MCGEDRANIYNVEDSIIYRTTSETRDLPVDIHVLFSSRGT